MNNNQKKVVITARDYTCHCNDIVDILKSKGLQVEDYSPLNYSNSTPEETLYEKIKDADYIIAGMEKFTQSLLERLPKLKCISRRGIGLDSVDLEACKKLKIKVLFTKDAVESAVAEHVMAYLLYFGRRIDKQNEAMKNHKWTRMMLPGIKNKSLGLVGFGGIGKEIAKRAYPFGMKIYYYCRHPNKEWESLYHVEYKNLYELLGISDYVSVNVPFTKETEGMINKDFIDHMKKDSVVINISRGNIHVDKDIREGVDNGKIRGACIDVFSKEPCIDSPLHGADGIILTPHTAAYTEENFKSLNYCAMDNLINFIEGSIDSKYIVC